MLDIIRKIINLGASTSPSNTINSVDVKKILRDAVIVGVGASLTFLLDSVHVIDFGVYTPLLVPILTTALNTAVKWIKDNSK